MKVHYWVTTVEIIECYTVSQSCAKSVMLTSDRILLPLFVIIAYLCPVNYLIF